jgi:hypothetical protein
MFTDDYGATAKSECDFQKTIYRISRISINKSPISKQKEISSRDKLMIKQKFFT